MTVFVLWLAKEIARHSFTGLNIIIFHEGLFNISYCHYNQQEKLENNYKTSFWKSQHFFKKKRSYTNARTPLPLFVFVRFSVIPCPPPLNERTFWMTPKLRCIEFYSCYLQQWLSIDLFSYWIPGRGQKGPMNKVCPSFCQEDILELAL